MDIAGEKQFDTNVFFSGGAGMFLQYHDIVKPVYLMAVLKMVMNHDAYGLPIDMISNLSTLSIIEWYLNRRYRNPLRVLDYKGLMSPDELDKLLHTILCSDDSLYKLAPRMNVHKLLALYTKQHMNFPVYVYTKMEEPGIANECKYMFPGVVTTYLHGDLKTALSRCDQNFTYMISDVTLYRELADLLSGTCSHLLLARDYRYNSAICNGNYSGELKGLSEKYPFLRLETNVACNPTELALGLKDLIIRSEERKET